MSCAGALGEFGAKLVLADGDPAVAERGRAALAGQGYVVEVAALDVTRSAQVDAVAQDILARHGRIDILVASAGIGRSGTPA